MLRLPSCDFCVHQIADEKDRCKAYPEGIPLEAMIKAGTGVECANGYSFKEREESYEGEVKTDGLLSRMIDMVGK